MAGAGGKEEVRRNGGCVGELVKLEERFTNHERQEVSKEEEQEGQERSQKEEQEVKRKLQERKKRKQEKMEEVKVKGMRVEIRT